tara:strand:- start:114349 stop:114681 length:333 start_codon:yes stop_codon:yes gene_type:complete
MTSSDIQTEFENYRKASLNGDDMAATQLESRFGEGLARFVRRVVRTGRGTGSLAEFVLHEADIVREQLGLERDELVTELISRLCSVITGQGIAGRVDTVSVADRQTVFAS